MTSPAVRILELLELLESSGLRTVPELAQRLQVDERTVRRYVERLRELDVPVESVRGRYGGYRIAPGFRMPPLMFSEDETVAVLVGLLTARAASRMAADASATATALAKIRRSLPRHLAERAGTLIETAVIDPPGGSEAVDPGVLLTTADAIRERRPLSVTYRGSRSTSHRTVQPHDLVAYRGRWYLVGIDSTSNERRTFRLDRVRSVRALTGTFPARGEHDPVPELVQGFAQADYRYTVRLRIQTTADHLARHLPPSVAELEQPAHPMTDGREWQRVTIHAEALDWLVRTLLAIDRPVVVEEPDDLRHAMLEAAGRLVEMAEPDRIPPPTSRATASTDRPPRRR